MQPAWVRSIQNQCSRDGVPFFFKQWGGTRKKVSGRSLDGRTFNEFPEFDLDRPVNSIAATIPLAPWPAFVPVGALVGA
jgi:hypothetical protein